MKAILILILFTSHISISQNLRWDEVKAKSWYQKEGWQVGCNYIPANAINQLEMWQKATFDTSTINKELSWAENIGFNSIRVFLHYLAWQQDSSGFKERMSSFLQICQKHKIKVILVLFDDCWNATATTGKQPESKPGIHNSGWLQCPGKHSANDSSLYPILKSYTKSILRSFKSEERIIAWDLYNEPGNSGYFAESLPLLIKVFQWAREVNPTQPLTAGVWNKDIKYKELNAFQLSNSDIISFHHYGKLEDTKNFVKEFEKFNRPILCTEYMARTVNSKFETHLNYFKDKNISAYNWGFVSGKTNTIFAWDTKEVNAEPAIWFHDIYRQDGSPYDPLEIQTIKKTLKKH